MPRRKASLLGLILLIVLASAGLTLSGVFSKKAPVQAEQTDPTEPVDQTEQPIAPTMPAEETPDIIVHAEIVPIQGKSSQNEQTQLVFQFRDLTACKAFEPKTVWVEKPDGTKTQYSKKLKVTHTCSEPAADSNTTDTSADDTNSTDGTNATTDPSASAEGDAPSHPGQVIIQLGSKVDITQDSTVIINDTQFKLSVPPSNTSDDSIAP